MSTSSLTPTRPAVTKLLHNWLQAELWLRPWLLTLGCYPYSRTGLKQAMPGVSGRQRIADPVSAPPGSPSAAHGCQLSSGYVLLQFFLTCFFSLFLLTALGLFLGTGHSAGVLGGGHRCLISSRRRRQPCGNRKEPASGSYPHHSSNLTLILTPLSHFQCT
jgi:hypothetical protein